MTFWVISRHAGMSASRPLYPRKQTFLDATSMSAKGQFQTLDAAE